MKKYYYIHKGVVTDYDQQLPAYYRQSDNFADQNECHVLLNKRQAEFYEQNPTATAEDVWNCELREVIEIELSPAERREREYEARIPRSMLDAYITYSAEQNVEKAQEIAQEIAEIKAQIRAEIPD